MMVLTVFRTPFARVYVVIVGALFLVCQQFQAYADDRAELPKVTFDDVVSQRGMSRVWTDWLDQDKLIVHYTNRETRSRERRVLNLDGSFGPFLDPRGRWQALSGDGKFEVNYENRAWIITDLSSGEVKQIPEASQDASSYQPSFRGPRWSLTDRYVAIVETLVPSKISTDNPESSDELVPIRIVGAEASQSLISGSRVVIYDREHPSKVLSFEFADSPGRFVWDESDNLYFVTFGSSSGAPMTIIHQISSSSGSKSEQYRTAGIFQGLLPRLSPNGVDFALLLDADNRVWDDFQTIVLVDKKTGAETQRLLPSNSVTSLIGWSTDGEVLYAHVDQGGLTRIASIPRDGGEPRFLTKTRSHGFTNISPDGSKLAFNTTDGYGRVGIHVLDIESGDERLITMLVDPTLEYNLGEWETVQWKSTDNVSPFGWIVYPPDFDANKSYPLLVDLQGGGPGSRRGLYGSITAGVPGAYGPLEWHAWAALGYIVFIPDFRSSGVYSAESISARYESGEIAAIKDIEDIISGTRFLTDSKYIDKDRVALFGHSAGGRRAYLLLTQYDDFSVGILNEPVTPGPTSDFIFWSSGRNSGGYPVELLSLLYDGKLEDHPERYKTNFMMDAYKVDVPLLIMMGNEDLGGLTHTPYEVVFSILRENSVPTRFISFIEEGHNYSSSEAALVAFDEMHSWLSSHLSKDESDRQ